MGIVVAIDGPSGAGKSSTAKAIATRAGWNYLDTGALYRAVTWLALEYKCEEPFSILQAIKDHPIKFNADPSDPSVFAGDTAITHAIRGTSVTENVSRISALPEIRRELLNLQHRIIDAAERGIVVEGRDIGTVVAPEAGLKIYLTADLDARAVRRQIETEDKSVDVKQSLDSRDAVDSTRAVSPLVMAADGSYTFTPALNYTGAVPDITYVISDGNGGTDTGLLDITIIAVNDAPVAADDNFIGLEDAPISGDLIINDSDVEGSNLTVTGFSIAGVTGPFAIGVTEIIPNVGTIIVNADGTFVFTPLANYYGSVPEITYTLSDGALTDTGLLNITVTGVKDAPIALDDAHIINEDNSAIGNVLTNDSDADNNTLAVSQLSVNVDGTLITFAPGQIITLPGIGTIVFNANGSYEFKPYAHWNGNVPPITYTVDDGNGESATAVLNITVTPVPDAPLATDDVFSVLQFGTVSGNILNNDSDVDTPRSNLQITGFTVNGISTPIASNAPGVYTIANEGTLTVNANGEFTFVH
jgi:cytidylate kinase